MKSVRAVVVVFGASAMVLVIEIIAGRLLAPYVGISLETFTGIIGTVLAGIAVGAAVGGALADRYDPRPLIGPALVLGGILTWLSLPIVTALGPEVGNGPVAIVTLTGTAFFLPVAVLSSVSPMVAKVRLHDLGETGWVVGGLSAAGTAGALAGTFITGFVLVAALPSKPIVIVVGAIAVVAGIGVSWWMRRKPTAAASALLIVFAAIGIAAIGGTEVPCQHETAYYCVRVERDAARPTVRNLYLDRLRHASVDLADPTYLDVRYVRLFADVAAALPPGPLDVLHIGGGGFSFPRYLSAVRPGTESRVLEIDRELVEIAEDELGLEQGPDLVVDVGDARLALPDLPTDGFDLVVGDAFAGESVPWHLTTAEVVAEIDRVLRPGGIYVMNVIDGGSSRFARAELATLADRFAHVAAILPTTGIPELYPVNQILLASSRRLPRFRVEPADGEVVAGREIHSFIGGARRLTDDHAPVDQLVLGV
jgi:MFS family permease